MVKDFLNHIHTERYYERSGRSPLGRKSHGDHCQEGLVTLFMETSYEAAIKMH